MNGSSEKNNNNIQEHEQQLLESQNEDRGLLTSENEDRGLIETEISEQKVLEHPTYKQLLEQLSQEENKSQELKNKWLLAQADLENMKRRTEREITNVHKYALEKFASEILVTVDNLERSLTTKVNDNPELRNFYTGIELTLKSLLEVLQKQGITPINPLGENFDPEKHTAITIREDPSLKPNTIIEVIQKGYWLKDRLLRPALVIVAK